MATENIRQYTVSDAVVVPVAGDKQIKEKVKSKWNFFTKASAPSTATNRPMTNMNQTITGKTAKAKQKSDKNEIFVDIFEKLSVLFN